MGNIPREYVVLFNVITETEQALKNLSEKLIQAQQLAEELYINKDAQEDCAGAVSG